MHPPYLQDGIFQSELDSVVFTPNELITAAFEALKKKKFAAQKIYAFYFSRCLTQSSQGPNSAPMFGTCLSSDLCGDSNGVADGPCAAGYYMLYLHTVR